MQKRKRRKSSNRSNPATRSPEELRDRAQGALRDGHFREAIAQFKAWLKIGDSAEGREGLATAYQGRARELAAKGLIKEALAIGEVRRELCPGAPPDPQHLALLLRAGRTDQAANEYRDALSRLDKGRLGELRARFAAMHLGGETELESRLPADDPVIFHGVSARAALEAYCRGDDASANEALAAIPFRSPYRDWGLILRALMKLSEDAPVAAGLLHRVSPDSPFAPLARAAELAQLPDSNFPEALAQAGEATRRFAAVFRGWSKARLAFWEELYGLGKNPSVSKLKNTLGRHRESLGESWVAVRGLRLLIDSYSFEITRSSVLGPGHPTGYEQALVSAWQAEEEGDPWYVFEAWQRVIWNLRQPSDPLPGSDDALRIALIQRRLDTEWHLLDYPAPPRTVDSLPRQVLAELEESLGFDPDDITTHVRLIAYHRAGNRLKQARRLVEQALHRWPQDPTVLTEALETSVAGGAFKKAAGFAHRVLALDPINTRARTSLLNAHLAHTRKQLGKGRQDLAERELEAAREWVRGEQAEVRLGLLHGFLMLDRDADAGTADLRSLVERLGGGISGQLALALEAGRLDYPLGKLMKRLRLPKVGKPNHEDLMDFFHRLRETLDAGEEVSQQIGAYFEPALKRAAGLELPQQKYEAICETLRRCGLDDARLAHARAALKRWPGLPIFELHAFEAKHEKAYSPVTQAEVARLEEARNRAHSAGDTRTAHRLEEILDRVSFGYPTGSPGFMDFTEPPPEIDDFLEQFGAGGLLEIMENLGITDPAMEEMERELGRDGMLRIIDAIARGGAPEEIAKDIVVDPLPPEPRRPRPKSRRKPGGKKPKRDQTNGSTDADDDRSSPDQPDLFE